MPVYFGARPVRNGEISATLSARGLTLVKVAPYSLGVLAYPLITIAVFFAYVAVLPAILFSSVVKKTVSTLRRGYTLPRLPSYLPLPLPKLAISFATNTLSPQVRSTLDSYGFVHTRIRGKDVYTHNAPTAALLSPLLALSPLETTDPPYGYVNLRDFRGALIVLKVLSAFAFVHCKKVFEENLDEDYVPIVGTKGKRKAADEGGASESSAALAAKKGRVVSGWDDVFDNVTAFFSSNLDDELMVKPLELSTTLTELSTFQVPPSGLLFPYVSDLSLPDNLSVVSFISTYLFKVLGDTGAAQTQNLSLIRSAYGHLKNTEFGFQTAHLATCFKMALQGQCVSKPLFSDTLYEGSILIGHNFEVVVNSEVYKPISAENLAQDIRNMGSHGNTLRQIRDLICAGAKTIQEIEVDELTSMYAIHMLCIEQEIGAGSLKDIRRLAALLKFSEPWRVNIDRLIEACDFIRGDRLLKEEDPIRFDTLGSVNRVELALGMFGMRCPSFRIPNGTSISLEKALPTPGLERGRKNQKRENAALWSVNVRLVSLSVALSDWEVMAREKAIASVSPSVASNAGFRSFASADRARLMGALRETIVGTVDFVGEGSAEMVPIARPEEETIFDF